MGGSKSKPKQESQSQYKASNDPIIAFMKMQQKNQLAQQQQNRLDSQAAAENARLAEEAKQQAMFEQQRQAGFTAAQEGSAAARQMLNQYGTQQQAADQAALASAQQVQSSLGSRSVGGMGSPIGAPSQAQKIANLGMGAGSSYTPASGGMGGAAQSAANIGAGGTGQPQNMFKLPSSSNIKFGGS
jgi:hypothetical protein